MSSHTERKSLDSSTSTETPTNFTPDGLTYENVDAKSLQRNMTGHSVRSASELAAIEKIVSRVSAHAGALGPLEEPIDHEYVRDVSKEDPNADVNDADPWKYPLDPDTGIRLVTFVGDNDPDDPRTWAPKKKWGITLLLGLICFVVAFASSVITGGMEGPMISFDVSMEVSILAVTLFVIGFGVGPIVFSPLSEEVGRRIIYSSTLFLGVIFIIPCAVAKNIGTLLVCRLIDGIAFSAPITLIGGSLSDIFLSHERGAAMAVFSAAPFLGPIIGPLVGGWIYIRAGWRWLYWVMFILSAVVYVFVIFAVPETHHQTILKKRKEKLIKLTGDDRYLILKDLKPRTVKEVAIETVSRPLILLTEPIVLLITIYMSVIYGLLYMYFFAFPVVFGEGKGWNDGMVGLMFIPIAIGIVIASAASPYVNKMYNKYTAVYIARGEIPPPELRLIPMMISCWLIPIGLFIFAWTSYTRLDWVGPAFGAIPCGCGFLLLYNSANNYMVDSYQHFAASALAAKTLVRSIHGATCVLYTVQMLHRLGYQWGISLLAFISLACCAIPYFFFFYGAKIRERSKYAYTPSVEEYMKANTVATKVSSDDEEKKVE
ncbi:hypothetical protein DASC09_034790 [Saccharomycopsis crataegensis]|uniref:Major facilitator superfamily (MFS) profile domain-containing protein n=1 Tax=Saccharomycopsis crataegensis TaxID=43959 RepID=A0AAV5QNB3_9ASCO|nr:hypothetical protein DASC09_034790 [Saccharomycopsis crataegensis]